MKLPTGGWRPLKRHTLMRNLSKYPYKLAIRQGDTYALEATEGFEAYNYVDSSGTMSLQVPDLNFFQVLKQTVGGRREVYSDIALGDHPPELFEPPSGVVLRQLAEPSGIVTALANAHQPHP